MSDTPTRRIKIYIEPCDWWIGYYRGDTHHYVCPLPCVVIRWRRRAVLREALSRCGSMMATDPRDWAVEHRDAWLYGLFCGWDCEDDHTHDDVCGDGAAMREIAARHGWADETVARLRAYRTAIVHLVGGSGA
jgi:hypothetical protein